MSELKPCPFCGQSDSIGIVLYRKNYGGDREFPHDSCSENIPVCVGCDEEDTCNPVISEYISCDACGAIAGSMEAWNTRPLEDAQEVQG